MEVPDLSNEVAFLIAFVAYIAGAICLWFTPPPCCEQFNCNQERDCSMRKKHENN